MTASHTRMVVALSAVTAENGSDAGATAVTLGRLARAGVAMPDGVVLTASAIRAVLAGLDRSTAPQQLLTTALPAPVEAALADIAGHFAETAVTVCSSTPALEPPAAPHTLQGDRVLDVRGLPALRGAVRQCWVTALDTPARACRAGGGPNIAILVQRQVEADVAGVACSSAPVSGDADEVRISAVAGAVDDEVDRAERATAQPDEWLVRGAEATTVRVATPVRVATAVRVAQGALTTAQALAVANLAVRVRTVLGGSVEVEWAMAGRRLLVVRARPGAG